MNPDDTHSHVKKIQFFLKHALYDVKKDVMTQWEVYKLGGGGVEGLFVLLVWHHTEQTAAATSHGQTVCC